MIINAQQMFFYSYRFNKSAINQPNGRKTNTFLTDNLKINLQKR